MPYLSELARTVPEATLYAARDVDVRDVVYDSRRVQPGDLFVALPGLHTHGRRYTQQAIERGAVGIIAEDYLAELPDSCALLLVPSARMALSRLAAALHHFPADRLRVVGVTGTDGKTTTCHLTAAILTAAGRRAGLLTTTHIGLAGQAIANPGCHTTPEAPDVQKWLATLAEAGAESVVVEVSSHALAQHRVDDCSFRAAAVTNLSPEHLNYHGSLDSYRHEKARLLRLLTARGEQPAGIAVLNADDPHFSYFRAQAPGQVVTFSLRAPSADFRTTHVEESLAGTRARLRTPEGEISLETRLLGAFNVSNWLAAAALAWSLGVEPSNVTPAAAAFEGVKGRLQRVDVGQPYHVFIDFAHTPQGLETVLRLLRRLGAARILIAFGNAGGRDPANRPAMGRIAVELADFSVFTTDDPEDEDPASIAQAIAAGAEAARGQHGQHYLVEIDRRRAFEILFNRARPGDVVLLAGRGHESSMPVGGTPIPFDDFAVAHELLIGQASKAATNDVPAFSHPLPLEGPNTESTDAPLG